MSESSEMRVILNRERDVIRRKYDFSFDQSDLCCRRPYVRHWRNA